MSSNTVSSTLPDLGKISAWMAQAVSQSPGMGAASQYSQWSEKTLAAIDGGLDHNRFCQALSSASRYGPKGQLAPSHQLVADADDLLPGWNPSRWTALEAVRVGLIVARAQADADGLATALEEAFRFADEGELCALYRSLQFLPGPERFVARSAEGCRTNMKTVFEANGCDTPFPAAHFDDVAWRQLCVKALFVESPLWRVVGFDARVDEELARMALDLADERRSAGRSVYPELWMCLGSEESGLEANDRKLEAVEAELAGGDELSRKGAILALGRLGQSKRLEEIQADGGTYFGPVAGWALMGRHDQTSFASVSPPEGAEPKTHHHEEGGAPGAPLFSLDD
jgi:hypothetical protein